MFPKKPLHQNSHSGVGSQALLPAQLGPVCGIDPTGNTSVPPSDPPLQLWSLHTIQMPETGSHATPRALKMASVASA